MSHRKSVVSLFVAWIAAAPFTVHAQNFGAAENLYNDGVQAYFSGRSSQADRYFSQLIALSPNDPRPYYFRSLARLRQGRQSEARADMQAGANVEARVPNRYAVGKSLERVQGQARLLLEQYRASARATAAAIPTPKPTSGPASAVVRERRVVPLEEFLSSGAPRSVPVVEPAEPTDTTQPAATATTPAETKAAAPATDNNPFGDDMASEPAPKAPAAKTPPAKAPPPAEPKATPKTPPPPKESPNTDENPFG